MDNMLDVFSSLPQYNTFRHFSDGDIKSYHLRADNGDSKAQLILGMCYMYGQVKDVNFEEAFKWLEKSAANGSILALFFLGNLYENGYGVVKNFAKSIEYYSKLFDATHVKEQAFSKNDNVTIDNSTELFKSIMQLPFAIYGIIGEGHKSINWNEDIEHKLENVLVELRDNLLLYQNLIKDKDGRYRTINEYFNYQAFWSNAKERFSVLLARHVFIDFITNKGFRCDKSLCFEHLLSYIDAPVFVHSKEFTLTIATQSNSPVWQCLSALLLWSPGQYKKSIDLFTKAKLSGLKEADMCLNAYINDRNYLLASNGNFGTADDRYKLARENQPTETNHRDSIDYNYWLLKSAALGNINAIHEISEVNDYSESLLDEYWQIRAQGVSLSYVDFVEDINKSAQQLSAWRPAMLNEMSKVKVADEAKRKQEEAKAEQSRRDKERARLAKERAELQVRQDAEAKAEQERIAKEQEELKVQEEKRRIIEAKQKKKDNIKYGILSVLFFIFICLLVALIEILLKH